MYLYGEKFGSLNLYIKSNFTLKGWYVITRADCIGISHKTSFGISLLVTLIFFDESHFRSKN